MILTYLLKNKWSMQTQDFISESLLNIRGGRGVSGGGGGGDRGCGGFGWGVVIVVMVVVVVVEDWW